jgi:hypothetical protein
VAARSCGPCWRGGPCYVAGLAVLGCVLAAGTADVAGATLQVRGEAGGAGAASRLSGTGGAVDLRAAGCAGRQAEMARRCSGVAAERDRGRGGFARGRVRGEAGGDGAGPCWRGGPCCARLRPRAGDCGRCWRDVAGARRGRRSWRGVAGERERGRGRFAPGRMRGEAGGDGAALQL